jgi:hypothetical protein
VKSRGRASICDQSHNSLAGRRLQHFARALQLDKRNPIDDNSYQNERRIANPEKNPGCIHTMMFEQPGSAPLKFSRVWLN